MAFLLYLITWSLFNHTNYVKSDNVELTKDDKFLKCFRTHIPEISIITPSKVTTLHLFVLPYAIFLARSVFGATRVSLRA